MGCRRNDKIAADYARGVRPAQISAEHGISVRQVQRILFIKRGKQKRKGHSKENSLGTMGVLVVETLKRLGKNFNVCERCGVYIPTGNFQIHHTKYDGATIYDLQIVCQRCNLDASTRFLT